MQRRQLAVGYLLGSVLVDEDLYMSFTTGDGALDEPDADPQRDPVSPAKPGEFG